MTAETRDALAYVCAHEERIRADLIDEGAGPEALDLLLAAAREDRCVETALEALHDALLASGDVLGVFGRGIRAVPTPLGVNRTPAGEIVYRCPGELCARTSWPEPGALPRCSVSGGPLRRDRL
ncbi:hypothetical protein POF50_030110 [Streptomyces sp. SL13]|uniref:Uncharacterized protein n=1 Tax=Streptantibioticus silvisoli TaxID=2705255 RepID=A0AA90H981_9ACTN|nr:hypothetical protein [Streptantibioticus silvisoli]MDI5973546.1 hypothetical protein [Streptantibioticus silvisoli]